MTTTATLAITWAQRTDGMYSAAVTLPDGMAAHLYTVEDTEARYTEYDEADPDTYYLGLVVTVYLHGTGLGYASLWAIGCTSSTTEADVRAYLTECARDLLAEARDNARRQLADLVTLAQRIA